MPVMPLLDQYGEPIKKTDLVPTNEILEKEIAGASLTGARSIIQGHPLFNMHPMRMAKLMLEADAGNMTSFLEMAEQIEERDCHYQSVLGTRKRAVAQMEITVDAASDAKPDQDNAELLRKFLNRDELESEIFDMLDAVGKGFSFSELIWDTSEGDWEIDCIKARDPRYFFFDVIDGETPLLRDAGQYVPLQPYKFIYHQHKAKSGLPIKGGVIRCCAWMWLFKSFGIKDWVVFSEAYGQPIRVGKYGPGTSPEDRAVLKRAIANLGSDVGAIIPDTMVVEIIESAQKAGSTDMFQSKSDWFDKQISKAVLGQTTTTDAVSGGHAVSKEHNDVRGDISRSDGKQLAATLNKQLVRPYLDLNRGPQKAYPRIRIGRTDDVNITEITNAAKTVVSLGGKVGGRKLIEMVGLPVPDDDEDALKAPAVPAAAPPDDGDDDPEDKALETARLRLASAAPASTPDAIGALADDLASDWQPIMHPLEAMLQKALKSAKSFDEFSQQLLTLASELDMKPVADQVAKAMFNAGVAGKVGAKLEGETGK